MRHRLRPCIFFVVLALAGVSLAQDECVLQGIPASISGADAAWLKINDVFVFYLNPVPPHMVEDSLVVPAQPIADLLGLGYRFDEAMDAATFTFGGEELVVRAGMSEAEAGGSSVSMPVPAHRVGNGNDLLVPVRLLIDVFDLTSSWSASTRVLSIRSEAAFPDPNISQVFLREVPPDSSPLGVAPRAFSLVEVESAVQGRCPLLRFEVTGKPENAGGLEPALFVMFRHPESIAVAGPLVHVSDDPANTSDEPCRFEEGQLVCRVDTQWNVVTYILGAFVAR